MDGFAKTHDLPLPTAFPAPVPVDDTYVDQARSLFAIAQHRLPRLVDPASGLVAFRADVDGEELLPAGTSVRHTAMAVLGVNRAAKRGHTIAIDHQRLLLALERALPRVDDAGDLGLVLWAAAGSKKALAERALDALLDHGPLTKKRGGVTVHATELAWVSLGLAEALAHDIGPERAVRARLDHAFGLLLSLRGASGLLAFARPLGRDARASIRRRLRTELGYFDAQIFAVLAAFARDRVAPDPSARSFARRIAEKLLGHQRPLGQWAFHYNVAAGSLVDVYPVVSAHQAAMAAMALMPAERTFGIPTRTALAKGMAWLFGKNEIGFPLADPGRALVFRSLRRRRSLRGCLLPLELASLTRLFDELELGARLASPSMLEIEREVRPDHDALCLFAFADLLAPGLDA